MTKPQNNIDSLLQLQRARTAHEASLKELGLDPEVDWLYRQVEALRLLSTNPRQGS